MTRPSGTVKGRAVFRADWPVARCPHSGQPVTRHRSPAAATLPTSSRRSRVPSTWCAHLHRTDPCRRSARWSPGPAWPGRRPGAAGPVGRRTAAGRAGTGRPGLRLDERHRARGRDLDRRADRRLLRRCCCRPPAGWAPTSPAAGRSRWPGRPV